MTTSEDAQAPISFPWFRFYSEALNDRKVKYICRATAQPRVVIIGAWAMLMSLANDSPIRGALLLTEELPFATADLADEMELSETEADAIITHLVKMNMLHQSGGVYYLTNWDKRQYASDSSTERVRRYRNRQKDETAPDETVTVTPGNGYGNAPDQIRAETEQNRTEEKSGAAAPSPSGDTPAPETAAAVTPAPETAAPETPANLEGWLAILAKPKANKVAILVQMHDTLFPGRDSPSYGYVGKTAKQVSGEGRLAVLMWQAAAARATGDIMAYCQGIQKGGKNGKGRTDSATPVPAKQDDPDDIARKRAALRARDAQRT